jgi:hypothetical protein
MAIVGLGGIGKTQVALNLVYIAKGSWADYSIFWVPALNMETFRQACLEIAQELHLVEEDDKEDAREVVKRYLDAASSGKWLLVVDNADDSEVLFGGEGKSGVVDYMPKAGDGKILFTTRYQDVAVNLAGGDVIELGKLQRNEARLFLYELIINKNMVKDDGIISELLDELADLPLAIAQAAAFINTNKISVAQYLRVMRTTEQDMVELISEEFRDDTRYDSTRHKGVSNAVARTWVVSFEQMQQHNTDAAELLAFLSCVEWKSIPLSMLPDVPSEFRKLKAIGTLCAYSFLSPRGDERTYDMHQLVHVATRAWMTQQGQAVEARKAAVCHLARIFPFGGWPNRILWRAYMPHAAYLCQVHDDVAEVYELCKKMGACLIHDNRIQEAVRWSQTSYRWRKEHLSGSDTDLLGSQHVLALACLEDKQNKQAIELLEHVVVVREKVVDENDPEQLKSQHALARAYLDDKQVKRALHLIEHVVMVESRFLPIDDPSRIVSQDLLDEILFVQRLNDGGEDECNDSELS